MMKQRVICLDLIRTVAILLVILCHSVEAVYRMGLNEWNSLSYYSQFFRLVAFTISRLGVPMFLFLSGSLLLNRNFDDEKNIRKFYLNNFLKLFICVEIWNILYTIFLLIFPVRSWSITQGIESIFFLRQVNLPNMWYMPMILSLYIFVPIIGVVVKKFDTKYVLMLMVPSIIVLFILPFINKITYNLYDFNVASILSFSFSGGIYGIYLILGYIIYQKKILKKISNFMLLVCLSFSLLFTCLYQIFVFKLNINYNLWYDFFGILLSAMFLFELLTRLNFSNKLYLKKFINSTSKMALGIFLFTC